MTKDEILNYCESEMQCLNAKVATAYHLAACMAQLITRLQEGMVDDDELRRHEAAITKAVDAENIRILSNSKPLQHGKESVSKFATNIDQTNDGKSPEIQNNVQHGQVPGERASK